jgi:hypothetical protein
VFNRLKAYCITLMLATRNGAGVYRGFIQQPQYGAPSRIRTYDADCSGRIKSPEFSSTQHTGA